MNDETTDSASLEQDLRIDEACVRYEAALRAGERPSIAMFLEAARAEDRTRLEAELRDVLGEFQLAATGGSEPGAGAGADPDAIVGPYVLEEKLGEGGMGEVWAARQEEPVRRRVAVKFIKSGMDSRAVLMRFEQERQALALLNHPNIARVLDAGVTPERRPWFAMELVDGRPLTAFCDENRLGIADRLRIFTNVCQAVQHAHQKGIVHRDLKPSNILVSLVDGKPHVKVIDFGVAKAVQGKITDESMRTSIGAVVGTLEYMAPEQANLTGDDVDTRADIYSLGVILYELLTGLRPFDGSKFRRAAIDEFLRILREEEPPRPSTRLSTSESPGTLAAARQIEPRSLAALIRGDLDWIVMKCLEKDRNRRYETASGLGRDVERYLANEPVEARPPSTGYRLRKFVRRNKGPVLAASLLVLALLGAVAGTSLGIVQARRAEADAIAERDLKETAFRREEAEHRRAEDEKRQAEIARDSANKRLRQVLAGNEVLLAVFTDLNVRDVRLGVLPLESLLAARLVKAAELVEGEAIGDPLLVADLQERLGMALLSLGHPAEALPRIAKCRATREHLLGPEERGTLNAINNEARALSELGRHEQAVELFERTAKVREAKFPGEADTFSVMNNLGTEYDMIGKPELAVPLLEKTLELRKAKHGLDHYNTLTTKNALAVAWQSRGRFDLALPMLEETAKLLAKSLDPDHPDVLAALSNLATCCWNAGQDARALELQQDAVRRLRTKLGPDHPTTMVCLFKLGSGLNMAGRYEEARPLLEESLQLHRLKHGRDHPATLTCAATVAKCLLELGRTNEGVQLLRDTLTILKERCGPNHPDTLRLMHELGEALLVADQESEASAILDETLKLRKKKLGADHPDVYVSMHILGLCHHTGGRRAESISMLTAAFEGLVAKRGREHRLTIACMESLARAHQGAGRLDKAVAMFQESLALRRKVNGANHPATFGAMYNLAKAHDAAKQLDLALPLYASAAQEASRVLGEDHSTTLILQHGHANGLRRLNKLDTAIPLLEKTFKGMAAKFGPDHPNTLACMGNLAQGYMSAKKTEQGLAIHEETVARHRAKFGDVNPQTMQALHNFSTACFLAKEHERAIKLASEALKLRREHLGPDSVETLQTLNNLAVMHDSSGNPAAAIPLFEEVLERRRKLLGVEHADTLAAIDNLGAGHLHAKQPDKERELRAKSLQDLRAKLPATDPRILTALDRQAQCELRDSRPAEAEKLWRECIPLFEKFAPDDWGPFAMRGSLGVALMDQKKYDEAAKILVEGYRGMKSLEKSLPPPIRMKLPETVDLIIAAFEALKRSEDVKLWKAEREKLAPAKK